jgi:hypothetical protein
MVLPKVSEMKTTRKPMDGILILRSMGMSRLVSSSIVRSKLSTWNDK